MARLPSVSDLGAANPGGGTRAIGTADASAIGHGYERLGAGLQQLGGGLSELEQRQATYEGALAHAGFTSDMIALNAQTQRELNYGPDANGVDLSGRYKAQAQQLRDKWGASVGSAPMRQRFEATSSEQIAQGQAQADTHAFGLYRDHQVAATDVLGEKLGNQAVATDDPNVHAQTMDAYGGAIDALAAKGLISQDDAVKRKRAFGGTLAQGLLIQQAQSDPLGALNHIRSTPGSDDELVERIIQVESGGKARAKNANSSAEGLGQFTEQTWLDTVKQARPELVKGMSDQDILALRADPNLNRQMTGALLQQNRGSLQGQGLQGTAGNLYLAHFLGAGGAAKLLKASPDTPVSQLLSPDAIAANRSVLQGRTAGSVVQWANGRMGGYSPGEGSIYSFIPPLQRARLESQLLGQVQAKTSTDMAGFKQAVDDTQAEANRTGDVNKPLQLSDFVQHLGADAGPKAYQAYSQNLQLGRDVTKVASMDPQKMQDLVTSYEPKPGDGYAAAAERQDLVRKAIAHSLKERTDDPAGFAVSRLPGTQQAYQSYSTVLGNPTASDGQRAVAARSFAATTLLEQQGAGIPTSQRQILPQADIDHFKAAVTQAATADSPTARVGLIGQIQAQQKMWGDYWPQVVQQLAPTMQPMVKAIAAGADTIAMTRLLSLDPKENPKAVLKEQSETKASDLTKALNTEMAPLLATMVGRQRDRDFFDYYGMAEKLGALYARDGKDASTSAHDAFNALIGNRYDFRDSYRIPKDSGVAADDVQAGALVARNMIGTAPAIQSNMGKATADLGLTSQEQALYQRHVTNLTGAGGVDNPDGSRSTLYQAVQEHAGKFYNIPTVWNGKIETEKYTDAKGKTFDVPNKTALANVEKEGWGKFPSYATADEADARYDKMHGYMERDTEQLLNGRGSNPMLDVKPAVDDVGGLSNAAADSLANFRRDGTWVTAPGNDGLNLMYGDKAVRDGKGAPLFLSWGKLAQLGGSPEARAEATKRATEFSSQTP